MQASNLQVLINTGSPDAGVIVKGESDRFEAVVIRPPFAVCPVVVPHRLVYATLAERMGS